MEILIGTNNKGKLIEIGESLKNLPITVRSPGDLGITDVPEEHGDTFEANALQKAHFYRQRSLFPTLADDSGILVEALQNELGIHTRRWGAGKDVTDHEWIAYFLDRMSHEANKRARFVCVLAYIDDTDTEHFFEGSCDGIITNALESDFLPGLPISACFKPDGYDRVYSALDINEKNRISHRGKATAMLHAHLQKMLLNSSQ
jgi:XTP/dITP diphosphohydrolase